MRCWVVSMVLSWAASGCLGHGILLGGSNAMTYSGTVGNMSIDGVATRDDSLSSGMLVRLERTPVRHVGAVMALLGTFDEAGVLPPEADPRANQLIHALIQFQSFFMKSTEPEVREYLSSALAARWGAYGTALRDSFDEHGWTSKSLEAVVEYSQQHAMWGSPTFSAALRSYNLREEDWALIVDLFVQARRRFESQQQDLHAVFARQRRKMPGGGL